MRSVLRGLAVLAVSAFFAACATPETGEETAQKKVTDPQIPASMFQNYHVFGPPTN